MASNVPFTQRLGAFKQRFQQVIGGRGSGYDELTQLEQPLVGDDNAGYGDNDNYSRSHGVSRPYAPADANFGSAAGAYGGPASGLSAQTAQTIPSQVARTHVCFPANCVRPAYQAGNQEQYDRTKTSSEDPGAVSEPQISFAGR